MIGAGWKATVWWLFVLIVATHALDNIDRRSGVTSTDFPAPVLNVPLSYNYQNARYTVPMELGSDKQPVSLVLDTGSGSIYTSGYNPQTSNTSVKTDIHPIFGYGSGYKEGSVFYKDSFSIPGKLPGDKGHGQLSVEQYKWLAALPYQPARNPLQTAAQGLVGFSPSGWNRGGKGNYGNLDSATGSLCPGADNTLQPCRNNPSVFSSLVRSGALTEAGNMFSLYIAANKSVNGGLNAGQLLLGGVDPSLAATPFISTPLRPNLWRTDFKTGKDVFVFWQFTPTRISLRFGHSKKRVHLCRQEHLTARTACTVIADTGYDSVVIGDSAALRDTQRATNLLGYRCASAIEVELPLNNKGTKTACLTIPLTTDGSEDCSKLTMDSSDFGPAPAKFAGVLPLNWFVFGQPILQKLYTVFDYTAFGGQGGLHFALAAKPQPTPAAPSIVVPVMPSSRSGMPVRQLQIGVGPNSSPVSATIDSGSGVINFNCLPPSGVPNSCKAASVNGDYYQASSSTMLQSCTPQQFEGGCSVDTNTSKPLGTCYWQYLYFPTLSQPMGKVSKDSMQIYGRPAHGKVDKNPSISFKGTFGCVSGANSMHPLIDTPDYYNALYPYVSTCPPLIYPNHTGINEHCPALVNFGGAAGFQTVIGDEAGHDRAWSSVPQQLFADKAISDPVWGLCVQELAGNNIGKCDTDNSPSYVVYGNRAPNSPVLHSTPMMTSAQINASVSALNMSEITQDRLQTRYMVVTTGLEITLQDGSVVKSSYDAITGMTNMDSGAFGALQIPNDQVYQAYVTAVNASTTAALANGSIHSCADIGVSSGTICSSNNNPVFGCFVMRAADSSIAAKQQAAAELLALYPKGLQWTFQGGATTNVAVAYTVPGCASEGTGQDNVFVCSHVTAAGLNGGVEYPLWVAQSWMYSRFIHYDLRRESGSPAGQFRFTDSGVDCSEFATV